MLFLPKALLTMDGESSDARYLYGVATALSYRGKGVMTRLEAEACRLAKAEGAKSIALVPAGKTLFDMYAKLGYRTRFYLGTAKVSPCVVSAAAVLPCSMNDFLVLRRDMLRKKRCSFDFYPEFSQFAYREYLFSGGEILKIETGKAVGYTVGIREGENCYRIQETDLSGQALAEAAGALRERHGTGEILLTGQCGGRKPFAMLKTLDPSVNSRKVRLMDAYANLMIN